MAEAKAKLVGECRLAEIPAATHGFRRHLVDLSLRIRSLRLQPIHRPVLVRFE
jgi:hypothetical protein